MPVLPEHILEMFLDRTRLHNQAVLNLGLVCWVMLVVAAWTWVFMRRHAAGFKVTSVYWLTCGLGIWSVLFLPVERVLPAVMAFLSVISLLFVTVPIYLVRRQWMRSWPGNLHWLHRRASLPPGLPGSVLAVGVFVLFLGLCYLTSWFTCVFLLVQAVALLYAVSVRYRDDLATLAAALLSLAFVSAVISVTLGRGSSVPWILNVAVFALAVLTFFWIWISGFWRQQVLDGQPLTTAARLVGPATHMGIMQAGIATLLAVKLTLWPLMRQVGDWDYTAARMAAGVAALLLLAAAVAWSACRLKRINLGHLSWVILACLVAYAVVRVPGVLYHKFVPHWPVWVVAWSAALGVFGAMNWPEKLQPLTRSARLNALVLCPMLLVLAVAAGPQRWQRMSIVAVGAIYAVAVFIRYLKCRPAAAQ